jgi:hypothetical protein
MVTPTQFLSVVEHIRSRFAEDAALRVDVAELCSTNTPPSVRSAAVAALVNDGLLCWVEDHSTLVRSDAPIEPPCRRTA